jgi:hypothetical protein
MPEAIAIVELWSVMKSYIAVKERRVASEQFLASAIDLGLIDEISDDLFGICDTFDKTLGDYKQEHDPDDLFDPDE